MAGLDDRRVGSELGPPADYRDALANRLPC
jgi:hypothetical protein